MHEIGIRGGLYKAVIVASDLDMAWGHISRDAVAHVRSAATRAQGTKKKSKKAYLHVCLQILIPKAVFAV